MQSKRLFLWLAMPALPFCLNSSLPAADAQQKLLQEHQEERSMGLFARLQQDFARQQNKLPKEAPLQHKQIFRSFGSTRYFMPAGTQIVAAEPQCFWFPFNKDEDTHALLEITGDADAVGYSYTLERFSDKARYRIKKDCVIEICTRRLGFMSFEVPKGCPRVYKLGCFNDPDYQFSPDFKDIGCADFIMDYIIENCAFDKGLFNAGNEALLQSVIGHNRYFGAAGSQFDSPQALLVTPLFVNTAAIDDYVEWPAGCKQAVMNFKSKGGSIAVPPGSMIKFKKNLLFYVVAAEGCHYHLRTPPMARAPLPCTQCCEFSGTGLLNHESGDKS